MDFTSALKPDVFRSFAIYLCPGVVAVAPWLYGIVWPDGLWRLLYGTGTLVSAGVVLFLGFAAGMILEEIGGCIEHWLDGKLSKKEDTKKIVDVFYDYLKTPSTPSIVADKFLSATITRYKFELAMAPALICAAVAFVKLAFRDNHWAMSVSAVFCLIGAAYLLKEASDSAALLHRVRKMIVSTHRGRQ